MTDSGRGGVKGTGTGEIEEQATLVTGESVWKRVEKTSIQRILKFKGIHDRKEADKRISGKRKRERKRETGGVERG